MEILQAVFLMLCQPLVFDSRKERRVRGKEASR